MNVSVFTIGRFHHFDLGRQLLRLRHRLSLFTSNPRRRVDRELLPFTKTHPLLRIPYAVGGRLGFASHLYWLDEALLKDLANWLERSLDVEWTDVEVPVEEMGKEGEGEWKGVRRRYWTLGVYRLPVATFMG